MDNFGLFRRTRCESALNVCLIVPHRTCNENDAALFCANSLFCNYFGIVIGVVNHFYNFSSVALMFYSEER